MWNMVDNSIKSWPSASQNWVFVWIWTKDVSPFLVSSQLDLLMVSTCRFQPICFWKAGNNSLLSSRLVPDLLSQDLGPVTQTHLFGLRSPLQVSLSVKNDLGPESAEEDSDAWVALKF